MAGRLEETLKSINSQYGTNLSSDSVKSSQAAKALKAVGAEPTGGTDGTTGQYVLPKRISDLKDNDYVSQFFSEYNSFLEDLDTRIRDVSYDAQKEIYTSNLSSIKDLLEKSDAISYIFSEMEDVPDELRNEVTKVSESLKQISKELQNTQNTVSKYDSEEAYNTAKQENEWFNKYSGKDSRELESLLSGVSDEKEKSWLGKYQKYVDYEEKSKLDTDDYAEAIRMLEEKYNTYKTAKQGDITAEEGKTEMETLMDLLDETGTEIDKRKAYLQAAKLIQEKEAGKETYDAIRNNADFEQFSRYDPANQEIGYQYINADSNGREDLKQKYGQYAENFEGNAYDSLSDEEKEVYNYLMNIGNRQGAADYLKYLQEDLGDRKAQKLFEGYEDHKGLEYVFGIEAGLDQARSGMQGFGNLIAGREEYVPASYKQQLSGMIREDLGDGKVNLPGIMGGGTLGQAVYDTVTTSANMAPSIVASTAIGILNPAAGAAVGNALMGATAAGNAYTEAVNAGFSKEDARGYGLLVGASEMVMEKVLGGITGLGGNAASKNLVSNLNAADTAFKMVIKRIGGGMLSEFGEEYLQEVLTPVIKNLTLGTHEDVQVFSAEALYSGILGALTAFVMEGPSGVMEASGIKNTGKAVQEAGAAERLAELGRTFSADTVAYQLAGKVDANTDAFTLGRLFNEIGASMSEQNKTDITNALVAEGMDLEIARKNAEVLNYIVEGGEVSDIQMKMIQKNNILSKVMREVLIDENSTVNQRARGYTEATQTMSGRAAQPSEAQQPAGGQKQTKAAPTVAKKETAAKNSYDLSGNGKTTYIPDGKEVRVKEIASIKDGKMQLKLEDDRTVDSKDVGYANESEALVYESVAKMDVNAAVANALVNAYNLDSSVGAEVYVKGVQEAYRYGQYGYPNTHGPFSSMLTEQQRNTAYKLGKMFSGQQVAKEQAMVRKPKGAAKGNAKGGVFFEGSDGSVTDWDSYKNKPGLKPTQETALQTMRMLSQVLGIKFYVGDYSSRTTKGGKSINGYYNTKDSSIHIDLNAGMDSQKTMLFTLGHELTHFIRQWSPAKFKVLANFLMEEFSQHNNMDTWVREKMDQTGLGYADAYEEVVADAMEAMLADGNVVQKLAKLKQQDKTLWQKIKDYIDNWAAKLKEAYEGLKPDSAEGKAVLEMTDKLEEIQQLFAEGLVEASENYQAAEQMGLEVDSKTESVAPNLMYSEKTWTESDYVQERNKAAKEISKAIGVSEKKAKAYIDSVNSIAKMIAEDRVRLDYFSSPNRSSFVGNVEYGGSFDFSTLCKKRRLLTGTFTAIQKALPNTALTANEILDIRNRMKEAGLEVSCGLFYVEGSRANMGQFAKEFLRLYKQYFPDAWQPNMADVNTPEGIEWVRINHPECYDQYEYFWNHYGTLKSGDKNLFASQQKPKLYQLHTEYKGEILQKFKNDDNVEAKNLNGGIRLQSFSDFEIVHLIDTMQIIMDMSRVGLAGQAYTKVPDFAWALGDTGLKINLSLIAKGVDENGKLIFDDIEGMPVAEAIRLRDRYSANVGTILVAFNDAQLLAAMADDRVDYIIPFHRSQWKKSQYAAMGLPAKTKDYTYMQNEKFIKPQYHEYRGRMVQDKATNYMPNEYWDFSKSGKENAIAYLEMCARNNKRPKFYKLLQNNGDGSYSLKADSSTDGYWKLLIDFKMYDNDGNGSPQMPVRPEFNMEESTRMLDEYQGGHSNFPVAQGIVDEFVQKYKDSHEGIKYSRKKIDSFNHSEYPSVRLSKQEYARFKSEAMTWNADKVGQIIYQTLSNDITYVYYFDSEYDTIILNKYKDVNIHERQGAIDDYRSRKKSDSRNGGSWRRGQSDPSSVFISDGRTDERSGGDVRGLSEKARTGDTGGYAESTSDSDKIGVKTSLRFDDNLSNRSLLMRVDESSLENPIEAKRLREYKETVAKAEAEEQVLQELNEKIRTELDQKKVKSLRFEVNKSINRLATLDKQILRKEAELKTVLEQEQKMAYLQGEQKRADAYEKYRIETEVEHLKTMREYRATRAELHDLKDDTKVMEKEFFRVVKEYEKLAEASKKQTGEDAETITKLRQMLDAEAQEHKEESAVWQKEFSRLLKEYDAAGRNIGRLESQVQKQRQSAKEKVTSRKKTEMRQKIRKVIRDLDKILNRGDKKRNVKEGLKDFVADALSSAEILFTDYYSNEDILRNGVGTDLTPEEAKLLKEAQGILEKISNLPTGYEGYLARQEQEQKLKGQLSRKMAGLKSVFIRERERLNKTKVSTVLGNLADAYGQLRDAEQAVVQGAYHEGVHEYLKMLQLDIGGTVIKDMTLDQLEELYKAYTMVMTTVRNANKMFAENLNATREALAQDVMREVKTVGGERKLWWKFGDKLNRFSWNNEKPVYAFERIGSDTLKTLYGNIRKGQDTWAVDLQDANQFRQDIWKQYNYSKWDRDKQYKFTSSSGADFELNLEQIMSIYAYSKREQAHDHLLKGGFVFDDSTEVTVTKYKIPIKFLKKNATAYNLSLETLEEIISKLTPEQRNFVDKMQDYLSTTMGDKGNEISMELYGVKLFNEKFYFPLRSAGQYMERAKEADLKKEQGQVNLVNSGFSKATKVKASNPVVLDGFMNVWAGHVNEMSMYHAFVLPMEDFRRVYNYSTPHAEEQQSASVNSVIQNAYGKAATDYIDQLYRDLNGGALTDNRTGVINALMGLFKKGAVFASLSVTVQQPSAIARATALIDNKYFIGVRVDAKKHKETWAEVKRYAPVATIKEMGFFDTNMGRSATDFLTSQEYSGILEKAKALVTDEAYRDELLSKAPALADELTWCSIWEAVKRETKDKHKRMDVKSEAFLKLAGERFSEVIDKTQVYDSVLARSANMRSKDTGMKMATAFMAEPTTSINMVMDALRKGKRGDKKQARKAIGAVVSSVILNSFLVAWVYAARDDDEDETYREKYLSSFFSSIRDGLNPMTYIPFLKDIVSIIEGYDVERSDMAVISDLWNAYKQLESDDVSAWRKVEGFVGSICQIFGLPVKNIMRDVRSIYQTYDTIVNGEENTVKGSAYAIVEGITGKKRSNSEQLYKARVEGDEEHEARVEGRYDDEDSANAAVRKEITARYMDDELTLAQATMELTQYAGMKPDEAYWLMDGWKYKKEHNGSDDGYSKYSAFYDAVSTGKNLKAVIQTYTDNGVKEETLSDQITEHFKEQYIGMSASERAALKGYLINAYEQTGMSREKAAEKLKDWDFEAKYGFAYSDRKQAYLNGEISAATLKTVLVKEGGYTAEDAALQLEAYEWEKDGIEGATTAAVRNYNLYCKNAGVQKDMYMKIRKYSNDTDNDVDANGKSIAYSAMKKVMAEINKLPISNTKKEAIAKSLGWKDSNIKKYAPWR